MAECTYDGLTLTKATETTTKTIVVNGLGPVSYWESYSPPVSRPSTGEEVNVKYMVNETTGKNILFSLTYVDAPNVTIPLRDEATGCPLWR